MVALKRSGFHKVWLEISILIHPVAREALCAFLFDLGCSGVISEDFRERTIKAYLPFQENIEEIRNRIDIFLLELQEIFPEVRSVRPNLKTVEDQDWGLTWRRFFKPEQVTRDLLILPAWEPEPASPCRHVIKIDPGPAFGTGQHATTRMCLAAMEKVPLPVSWSMLDVGTGSGILAIYGARLGAEKIVALNIDTEALRWAERNVELNGQTGSIDFSHRPLEQLKPSFFLLTANLILGEILNLLPHFSHHLNPGGWLIISGILREQVKEVESALQAFSFHDHDILYWEEWACIITRAFMKGSGP